MLIPHYSTDESFIQRWCGTGTFIERGPIFRGRIIMAYGIIIRSPYPEVELTAWDRNNSSSTEESSTLLIIWPRS
jgi:hypothetical protein